MGRKEGPKKTQYQFMFYPQVEYEVSELFWITYKRCHRRRAHTPNATDQKVGKTLVTHKCQQRLEGHNISWYRAGLET